MTDQQAPERIWFYADPIAGWLGSAKSFTTPDGVSPKPYVPLDLLEVAEKQRDELASKVEELEGARILNRNAIKRLKAERDELAAEVERLTAELDQECEEHTDTLELLDQALAASVAREIAMRDRAAERIESIGFSAGLIRSLPLSPDATAALNEALADAWEEGWTHRNLSGLGPNPYRKENA